MKDGTTVTATQDLVAKNTHFNLSAGDLGFGQDCPRCLWLKVNNDIKQPGGIFSSTILDMERKEKERLTSLKNLQTLLKDFPNGHILFKTVKKDGQDSISAGGRPTSAPVKVGDATFTLNGTYDFLVELETGGYAVVLWKSSAVKENNLDKVKNQLNAIAYTLSHNKKADEVRNVRQAGVIIFDPNAFDRGENPYQWQGFQIDEVGFENLLLSTGKMLMGDCPDVTRNTKQEITCDCCKRDTQILSLTR